MTEKQIHKIMQELMNHETTVHGLIDRSFLSERFKRNYSQAYLTRLAKLKR
jgi:serine/threonine-protein kinase HipA